MNKKLIPVIIWPGIICTVVLMSCNPPVADQQAQDRAIMDADKPVPDTTRILETLDLYRARRYEGIPEALDAGTEHVYKLVLYGQRMGSLSPDIGRFTYLQSLDIALNELTELPREVSQLHYLQGFYANGNALDEFPAQILLLPLLSRVDLSDNMIREIPAGIAKMDQLTRLSLNNNSISDIPEQLFSLKNLSVLGLAGNNLIRISGSIGNLVNLEKLDLADNFLTDLPAEITLLSGSLIELNIRGNQITPEKVERLAEALPKTRIRY